MVRRIAPTITGKSVGMTDLVLRLHRSTALSCRTSNNSGQGFSLVEILIVILVAGILSATGVSVYSGVVRDTQTRTITDELNIFFTACRHRAMLRKLPVRVRQSEDSLFLEQSPMVNLRIPELDRQAVFDSGLVFDGSGVARINGTRVDSLALALKLPGNKTSQVVINFLQESGR